MTNESEADFVPANGVGLELFEAPALFFLTHAESIRRWSDLEEVARSATNAYLETVGEDLEGRPAERSWAPGVADVGKGYRLFLFAPPGTPPADDDTPSIACFFGWNQKRVRITAHIETPFVGVRVGLGENQAQWRSTFLDGGEGTARRTRESGVYRSGRVWPAWKQVTGHDRWWEDLDAYRSEVVSAFNACLESFAIDVERTVVEISGGTAPGFRFSPSSSAERQQP